MNVGKNRRFVKKLRGLCSVTVLVASAIAGGGAGTAMAEPVGSSGLDVPVLSPAGCADNIVIGIPGGGNTVSFLPNTFPQGPYVRDVGENLRATSGGRVIDRYVPYHSIPGGTASYQQARQSGYDQARNLLAQDATQCPQASFSIVGYSMGADVGSHLVHDIALGLGPIPQERLGSAVLIANPHRVVNGVANAGGAPSTMGAFGPMAGGYGVASDRVLEVCRAGDIVCDTPAFAAPIARALASAALFSGVTSYGPAIAAFLRLPLGEQITAIPRFLAGSQNHMNYYPVAADRVAADFIRARLH